MTWSYTGPSNSESDAVRFLVGDTDVTDQLITDEEITYLLAQEGGNATLAAARAAEGIAAKFSRYVSETVGRVRVQWKESVDNYRALAAKLRTEYDETGGTPFAGGISVSDKETTRQDADRVRPDFSRDLHEDPRNPDNSNEAVPDPNRRYY